MPLLNRCGGGVEPTLQTKSATPSEKMQRIEADSDYDGLLQVSINPIPQEYKKPSETQDEKEWLPTDYDQIIRAGTYCLGKQTIKGDADLVSENIKSGVTIFGVTGTYDAVVAFTSSSCLSGDVSDIYDDKVWLRFTIPISHLGDNTHKPLKAYAVLRFNSTNSSENGFLAAMWHENCGAFGVGIDNRNEQTSAVQAADAEWSYNDDGSLNIDILVSDVWAMNTFTGTFSFLLCF